MGMAYVQVLVEVLNECFIDIFLLNKIIFNFVNVFVKDNIIEQWLYMLCNLGNE
jgi:hypothetical protein